MKALSGIVQVLVVILLSVIAYHTGVGKTVPVHHPSWMECNGHLSRALFYSTLLGQSDDLKDLAAEVKKAGTIEEIDRLVHDGSNIDAPRTQWYESVSDPGKCQAQVFLKNPNKDGENTAYVGFEIGGFAEPNRGLMGALTGGHVLQSIRLDMMGIKWFKE